MKSTVPIGLSLLLCAALLAPPVSAQSDSVPAAKEGDAQALINRAGQAYYNLRSAGLGGFQCNIEPDWNALLVEQRRQDPQSADETIRLFSTLHFTVTVDQDGRTALNHDDIITDNRLVAQTLLQMIDGMGNITNGFFVTWVLFALASPLPSPGAPGLRLDTRDMQYRLSYLEGPAEVVIDLDHDYAMRDLRLSQPGFRTLLEPLFTHTANGLVLESYSYRAETGSGPSSPDFHVHVSIAYQQVEGFQLPQHLDVDGGAAGSPFKFSLVLSGCHTVRNANPSI